MNFHTLIKRSLNLVKSNAPEILTGIGVGGVVITSYLTGKASYRASELIHEMEDVEGSHSDPKARLKERSKLVWKLYIPPVASGVVTVGCIVASQKSASRRTAVAMAAYSLTERTFAEYKEKVVEELGKGKEQKIRDKIAQDAVTNNPPKTNEVIITSGGNVLFMEGYTGRYLRTDMEEMRRAVNEFNHHIIHDLFVPLAEFYDIIGLDHTDQSIDIGWTSDKLMELNFHAVVDHKAGEPCIVFKYDPEPKPLYD